MLVRLTQERTNEKAHPSSRSAWKHDICMNIVSIYKYVFISQSEYVIIYIGLREVIVL